MNFSKGWTLLVSKFTPNTILSAYFAIPCAICTKMGSSTLVLTSKHFVIYGVMKEFIILESKKHKHPYH
jgi:hypothetical protein